MTLLHASENELYTYLMQHACVYCVSVLILCILGKKSFSCVVADKFSNSTLPLAAVAISTFSIVKDQRQLIH